MIGRIFADFNSMTRDDLGDRVLVGQEGSWQIERYKPLNWLVPGGTVKLSDGELEVTAVLEFVANGGYWYGRPDWATRRDLDSPADGLEALRTFPAEDMLVILRNELGLRIQALQAEIKYLSGALASPSPKTPIVSIEAITSALATSARELRDIFEALIDPIENGPQHP